MLQNYGWGSLINQCSEFWLSKMIWRCKEHPTSNVGCFPQKTKKYDLIFIKLQLHSTWYSQAVTHPITLNIAQLVQNSESQSCRFKPCIGQIFFIEFDRPNWPRVMNDNTWRIILLTLLFSARATQKKNEAVKCHNPRSHQRPLYLQSINLPAELSQPAPKPLPVKLLGNILRLNQDLKSGYNYNFPWNVDTFSSWKW